LIEEGMKMKTSNTVPIDTPRPAGVPMDTAGPLRMLCLQDAWYIIGEGQLVPVDGPEEAEALIDELTRPEAHERECAR
jgi:hypothetical protein